MPEGSVHRAERICGPETYDGVVAASVSPRTPAHPASGQRDLHSLSASSPIILESLSLVPASDQFGPFCPGC